MEKVTLSVMDMEFLKETLRNGFSLIADTDGVCEEHIDLPSGIHCKIGGTADDLSFTFQWIRAWVGSKYDSKVYMPLGEGNYEDVELGELFGTVMNCTWEEDKSLSFDPNPKVTVYDHQILSE